MNVTLIPGPVVVPGQVTQSDVKWTLTPQWVGGSPVTVNGNAGVAMVPALPDPGARVLVSISLKANLQGNIGGIVWPPMTIPIDGPLTFLALTEPSHAISALFSFGVTSVPVPGPDGQAIGLVDKPFAGVSLLGIA